MSFLRHCFWIVVAAISLLPKLFDSGPKTAREYLERAMAACQSGNLDRAIADCTEAIRLNPQLLSPRIFRAESFNAQGEHDQAIADCDEVIRLDPKCEDAYKER